MGAGRRRAADIADRRRHRWRSRSLSWLREALGAKPTGILDVLLGVVLAVTAYGGVSAVAFSLTMPPFAEYFALPRWTIFAFFTVSGMALTSTLLQAPLFLLLILVMRRRRAATPALVLVVGGIVGAIAGLIFTFQDGAFVADRFGDLKSVLKTTLPVSLVLAVSVIFASWLRRRGGDRGNERLK